MAVAFDAVSAATQGTGNLSWTHTPVGTPRGVKVHIRHDNNVDEVSGVTYGGVAMTEVAGSPNILATSEQGVVYGYFLGAGLPTGPQTVVVTVTGSTAKDAMAITVTAGGDTELQDVDATINSGSLENPSVTLSLGGKTCFCSIGFLSGIPDPANVTPFTNWTSRSEVDYGAFTSAVYTYDIIGTTDVTAGWTQVADDAVAIAMAIMETVPLSAALARGYPDSPGSERSFQAVASGVMPGTGLI